MTELRIRRIRFDLDGEVPFNWNAGNPAFSTYMNMVSMMAICFEKMLVSAVREAMPRITDPAVADEAEAFLRQEAQHANAHRQHLRALAVSDLDPAKEPLPVFADRWFQRYSQGMTYATGTQANSDTEPVTLTASAANFSSSASAAASNSGSGAGSLSGTISDDGLT